MNKKVISIVLTFIVIFTSSIIFCKTITRENTTIVNLPSHVVIKKIGGSNVEISAVPGQIITIPDIAPGQIIEIGVNPRVFTGGIFNIGGSYDKLVAENLPNEWVADKSTGFSTMNIKIKVSPFATDGEYKFNIMLIDEDNLDQLGNYSIPISVNVKKDILQLSGNKVFYGVAGEPVDIEFTITNKGNYPETFALDIKGQALTRIFVDDIFLQPGQSKTIKTKQKFAEAVSYTGTAIAYSKSSSMIEKQLQFVIRNDRSLKSDIYSVRNGILIFPANIYYSTIGIFAEIVNILFPEKYVSETRV